MGGFTRGAVRNKDRALEASLYHPSFELPEPKEKMTREELVEYVVEASARLISPSPKVANENYNISCDTMASLIRNEFLMAVKEKVIP